MSKRVLDVGQCGPDHMAIRSVVEGLGAEIHRVAKTNEALERLRRESFDLVLVNRKLDSDYTDGTDLIRAMQADTSLRHVPVMLVSNYAEAQAQAVNLGAVPGFGKLALGSRETHEKLNRLLQREKT